MQISHKKILIFGFKSSGKSTFGKKLSENLNLPFFDIDLCLLSDFPKFDSITDLFYFLGEKNFRELEKQLVEIWSDYEEGIFALGGGSLENYEVKQIIEKFPVRIFLNPSFEILKFRIESNPSYAFFNSWEEKYLARRPTYEKFATIIITEENSNLL